VHNPAWDAERTLVELLVEDSPFLIDSITVELHRQNLRIYQVIHPLLQITRDGQSKITGIENFHNKNTGALESIMQFHVTYVEKEEDRQALARGLCTVLEAVRLAVADWKPMVARAEETVHGLGEAPNKYNKKTRQEVQDFMRWMKDNHFTFLGTCDFVPGENAENLKPVSSSALGIFKLDYPRNGHKVKGINILTHTIPLFANDDLVNFSKSTHKSLVHRHGYMDYVAF